MCLSATMRRPLRSKRAMISPVSPRSNASGLTRMSVRSIGVGVLRSKSGRGRRLERGGGLALEVGPPAAPAARQRRVPGHLGLAVGADGPLGVERPGAVAARVLELAHAVRAAQELLLDVLLAVRAHE